MIGRNDRGQAVGVSNAARLLEEIPNKVRDVLGIMVDVNLLMEDGKDLLEIRVEPYPSPISYKGEYHFRSGSTKQELKGAALSLFAEEAGAALGWRADSTADAAGLQPRRPAMVQGQGGQERAGG